MTWKYEQRSGHLYHEETCFMGGYSGCAEGKNNPEKQDVPNVGPIPRGIYRICDPYDTAQHGPYVLPLVPDSANEMHGRFGFMIHGDSKSEPGSASLGCIIQPRAVRELIHQSGDRMLEVVE